LNLHYPSTAISCQLVPWIGARPVSPTRDYGFGYSVIKRRLEDLAILLNIRIAI
jgi:hypothetical protein